MAKLKVWSGNVHRRGKQYPAYVVATSKRLAAALAGTSLYDFNKFWAVPGNAESAKCLAQGGGCYVSDSLAGDYSGNPTFTQEARDGA